MAKILVIDDDPLIREMVTATLEGAGHVVTAAADGWEGMKKFRPYTHQLVITDVYMPQVDGIDLLRVLRREVPSIAVIVITAHQSIEKNREKASTQGVIQELGATRFLSKPFMPDALLEAVNASLPH